MYCFLSVSLGISARLKGVRFWRGRTLTETCWWSPRACRRSDPWTPAQDWKSKACPDQIQKPFMHLSKKEYSVKLKKQKNTIKVFGSLSMRIFVLYWKIYFDSTKYAKYILGIRLCWRYYRLWYVGLLSTIYCYDMNHLIIMYLIRYVCSNIK